MNIVYVSHNLNCIQFLVYIDNIFISKILITALYGLTIVYVKQLNL